MGETYKHAIAVVIFLGEPTAPTSSMGHDENYMIGTRVESALANTVPRWYERQWPIQEFVLAKSVLFQFGGETLNFTDTDMTSWMAGWVSRGIGPHVKALYKMVMSIDTLGIWFGTKQPRGIAVAATVASSATARDPRDKIYSLLGIIDQTEASMLDVDYNIIAEGLFARTTYTSIIAHQGWDDLVRIKPDDSTRNNGLPSWALDFARKRLPNQTYFQALDGLNNPRLRLEGCKSEAIQRMGVQLKSDTRSLIFSGICLDRVVATMSMRLFKPASAGNNGREDGSFGGRLVGLFQTAYSDGSIAVNPNLGFQYDERAIANASVTSLLDTGEEPDLFATDWVE
jgi:hypothetical protein